MRNRKDLATGKWELWRRLLLLFCFALAAWFYMYASASPLLRVQDGELARRQGREITGHFVTERQRHLATLPLDEYAKAIAGDNLVMVEGEEWDIFISKLKAVNGRNVPEEWQKHVQEESLNGSLAPRLFFDIEKEPLRGAWSQAADPSTTVYLKYAEQNGPTHYIQVTHMTFTYDDFSIGGISGSFNAPPDSLLHPVRPLAYVFIVLGLFIYLKIPKPRHKTDSLVYTRWKNVVIDMMAVILFTMFFAMPFLIVGGSVQSIAIMSPVVLVFWGMALLISLLMYISAWNASFSMNVEDNQLTISNYRGGYTLVYEDVEYFQPAEKRYPKWFKLLMLLAMLGSSGSMKPVMTAQWLNSAGVQSQGLRLHMKNGEKVDFWLADQMGNQVFSRVKKLLDSFSMAEIPWREEMVTDQSLSHVPGGAGFWDKKPVLVPYAVLSFLFLLVMLGSALMSEYQMASAIPESRTAQPIEATSSYPDLDGITLDTMKTEWVNYYGGEGVDRGVTLQWVPETGYAISGVSNSENFARPAQYMILTDKEGTLLWEQSYPSTGKDSFNESMIPTSDGGYLLTGAAGDYLGRSAFLTKIDSEGKKEWHREYIAEENSVGVDLWQHPEGDYFILLNGYTSAMILRTDPKGNEIWKKTLLEKSAASRASRMLVVQDGNILISGSVVQNTGDFWQASLTMLDEDGNTVWQREYGAEGDDRILAASLLEEGTAAFTGFTHAASSLHRSVYLLITNLEGEIQLEKEYSLPQNNGTGVAITQLTDGNLAVLANVNSDSTTHDFALVTVIDPQGEVLSAHRLEARGEVRGSDMILTPEGSLLITGMAGRQEGLGSNSVFLLKTAH